MNQQFDWRTNVKLLHTSLISFMCDHEALVFVPLKYISNPDSNTIKKYKQYFGKDTAAAMFRLDGTTFSGHAT